MSTPKSTPAAAAISVEQVAESVCRLEWESRWQSTAQIGALISCVRTDAEIDILKMAKASGRTVRWLRAVERGELLLTETDLKAIELGLRKSAVAAKADPRARICDKYTELLDEPFGELARGLDELVGELDHEELQPRTIDVPNYVPSPIGVDEEERLLVLAPALTLIAWVLLAALSTGLRQADDVDFTTTLGSVGLLTVCSFLFVSPLGSVVAKVDRWSVLYRSRALAFTLFLEDRKLPVVQRHTWYQPAAALHIHPDDRKGALRHGLLAALSSRILIASSLACALILFAFLGAMLLGSKVFSGAIFVALAAGATAYFAFRALRISVDAVLAAFYFGSGKPSKGSSIGSTTS